VSALVLASILYVVPLMLARHNAYCYRVALGIDLWASALTNGRPGETLSGRCGTAYLQDKLQGRLWCPIIDAIMGEQGHCVHAIHGDILRARAVIIDDQLYDKEPL
jgi:hypothetical protein